MTGRLPPRDAGLMPNTQHTLAHLSARNAIDRQLVTAAKAGDLEAVKAALAAGADPFARECSALGWGVLVGSLPIVQQLLARMKTPDKEDLHWPLRYAANAGNLTIAKALLGAGATLDHIPPLQELSREIQALFAQHLNMETAISDYALQGACPEALCVLLERQGQAELATMITATRMLEPLTPDERAVLLNQFLENPQHLGIVRERAG